MQGRTIRCSLAEVKYRLFIGNIPKSLTEDEFRKVVEGIGPGTENIELIKVLYELMGYYPDTIRM